MFPPSAPHHEVTLTLRVEAANASARIFRLSEAFVLDTFRLSLVLQTSESRLDRVEEAST